MEEFNDNISTLLEDYEGYFAFGQVRGVVSDQEITFLELPFDNPNVADIFSWAEEHVYFEIVKYLIENFSSEEIDIHRDDDFAFRWAAFEGRLNMVKYLVARGADIRANNPDEDGNAIAMAARVGHLDVIKYLVDQGAVINFTDKRNALEDAIFDDRLDIVKYIFDNIDILDSTKPKWTKQEILNYALRCSASDNALNTAKYLVDSGANIRNLNNRPLHLASEYGHLNMVIYLVKQGAEVENPIRLLKKSVERGHLNIVKYLVNLMGGVTEDIIRRMGEISHREIKAYLRNPKYYDELKRLYDYLIR